jgi:hypothetical protein
MRAAGEDPAQYVDITIKVPECKFATWPDAIRAGFESARTVRTGNPKMDIVPQEDPRAIARKAPAPAANPCRSPETTTIHTEHATVIYPA